MSVLKQYNETTQQWEAMNFVGDNFFSNRNLLDNPWFTVNQRGQNSYSVNNYTVDRWLLTNGELTVNSDKTVSLVNGTTIEQRFEEKLVLGKTYTASVLLSNGMLIKGTIIRNSSASQRFVFISGIALDLSSFTEYDTIQITNATGENTSIKAVKLELSPISTLANDSTPNYATELVKCMRYFQKPFVAYRHFIGFVENQNLFYEAELAISMRAVPTATLGTNLGYVYKDGTYYETQIYVDVGSKKSYRIGCYIASLASQYTIYAFRCDGELSLSADL